jgi:hypothetical protein
MPPELSLVSDSSAQFWPKSSLAIAGENPAHWWTVPVIPIGLHHPCPQASLTSFCAPMRKVARTEGLHRFARTLQAQPFVREARALQ